MKDRFKPPKDLHLDRMFETRSAAWERVGLAVDVSQRAVRRARREVLVLLPLLVGVLIVYSHRFQIFGINKHSPWDTWIRIGTVLILLALGWTIARDIGRAAGPTFFRRMDPATAGTVGFLIRLVTIAIVLIVALRVAAVDPNALVAGTAFTAVILGLAAQQTLGNLFAGLVLLTARPFRVGERVRLQSGPIGGVLEGVVSSLGLMYTTFARGDDRIMIPNNGVLSSVVVPLMEPDSVDVKVRLRSGVRPSRVQAMLDDQIKTPTRAAATVLLEEIDGDDVRRPGPGHPRASEGRGEPRRRDHHHPGERHRRASDGQRRRRRVDGRDQTRADSRDQANGQGSPTRRPSRGGLGTKRTHSLSRARRPGGSTRAARAAPARTERPPPRRPPGLSSALVELTARQVVGDLLATERPADAGRSLRGERGETRAQPKRSRGDLDLRAVALDRPDHAGRDVFGCARADTLRQSDLRRRRTFRRRG